MPGLLQLAGALVVTLGALALGARLLTRLHAGRPVGDLALRVLARTALGPRQSIALLQVGERVLVLSVAEEGTRLLAELDEEASQKARTDGEAAVAATAPGGARPSLGTAFRRVLAGRAGASLGGAALLLALAPGGFAADAAAPASAQAQGARASQVKGQTESSLRNMEVRPPAPPRVDIKVGDGANTLQLEGAVGLVVFLGTLTLLPALLLLMTSFTRILIVLHFLRSAIGAQTTPPNQLLVALAVLLTGVVMQPTLTQVNETALQPFFDGRITQAQAYGEGVKPFREFILANVRERDVVLFAEMSRAPRDTPLAELPTVTLVAAFVTSELRTAFQMGFVIFLPFLVVDLIVASVLMSLGMFMLPPVLVSLPFKLLLFVLADGWTLVVQNLVASFR